MQQGQPEFSLAEAVKIHILQTLVESKGNRTRAAKRLGISVRCLRDKLRHYSDVGIEIPEPASSAGAMKGRPSERPNVVGGG